MSGQVDNPKGSAITSVAIAAGDITVRECTRIDEFDACVRLQREVFGLPALEVSPRRHLIVSRRAGGWILGAFAGDDLIGFVHHLVAVRGAEIIGYSHMLAVSAAYQDKGVGALLKWAQRALALAEGRRFITWTWDPMRARNAHFNLNRLGATAHSYSENFYGTDYDAPVSGADGDLGIDSDRLFADWELDSPRVEALARRGAPVDAATAPDAFIEIPSDWSALMREDAAAARREQRRVRAEFQRAFAANLICAGFAREASPPRYLLYQGVSLAHSNSGSPI